MVKQHKSRQSDKKKTKQVRIDAELHRLLKIKSARTGETSRSLVEGALADILGVENGWGDLDEK